MRWTTVPLPAGPDAGHPVPRIARTVATEAAMAELDARLVAVDLTHRLSLFWQADLRGRTRARLDATRAILGALDPEDAETIVAGAVDEARREGIPRPYAPPVRSRQP